MHSVCAVRLTIAALMRKQNHKDEGIEIQNCSNTETFLIKPQKTKPLDWQCNCITVIHNPEVIL